MANNATANVKANMSVNASGWVSGLNKVKQSLSSVAPALQNIKNNFKQTTDAWLNGAKSMSQATLGLRNTAQNLVDGFRQVTQGLLSMGRAVTFFISLPLTAFLKTAIQSSIEYEKALTRVAKVSGWKFQDSSFKALDGYIRDITSVAGSSHDQFLSWAESLGSFGVDSVEGMKKILPIIEMFVQGTDVAADTAVADLGKVANQFGYSMSASGDALKETTAFLWKFANTVNTLENISGATAKNILAAVADAGPALTVLGVPPEVITSWSALGVQAGLTEGEVGTGLRNLGMMMAKNYEKISQYPALMKDLGVATAASFKSMLGADFEGTIAKMLKFYSQNEDAIGSMAETYDFLGMRADKLFLALQTQMKDTVMVNGELMTVYDKMMQAAEEQWKKPVSLMQEYEMMTQTTAFATQQLQNNVRNLGLTIGDALLPALNDFVSAASPVVQAFAGIFKSLGSGTQRTIFLVIGLSAILGPVVFFLSQMAFGLTLVTEGILKFGNVLFGAVKWLGVLGVQMFKLNPIAWAVAAGVTSAFGMMKDGFGSIVSFVLDTLKTLLNSMKGWGGGIFGALADGIKSAEGTIRQAITGIAEVIASFFEAFSPPKAGPLKHIDLWGRNLFDTYLEGFKDADFGILSDVGSVVQHIFESWVTAGKLEKDSGAVESMTMGFRENLAKLLSTFNQTGNIDLSAINALTAVLGEESEEVAKLIELNLKLKKIKLDLEAIDKRKTQARNAFRGEVRSAVTTNMTLAEKVAIIQDAAKERDRQLMLLDAEQEYLEEQETQAQSVLDIQKQMTDAMRDQDRLEMGLIDALNSLKSRLGGLGAEIAAEISKGLSVGIDTSGANGAFDYFSRKIAEMKERAYELQTVITGVFLNIKSVLAGEGILSLEELTTAMYNLPADATEAEIKGVIQSFNTLASNSLGLITNLDKSEAGVTNFNSALDILTRGFSKDEFDQVFGLLKDPAVEESLKTKSLRVQGLYDAFVNFNDANPAWTIQEIQDAVDAKPIDDFGFAFAGVNKIMGNFMSIYQPIKDAFAGITSEGSKLGTILKDSFTYGLGTGSVLPYIDMDTLTPFERAMSIVAEVGGVLAKHLPTIISGLGELAVTVINAFFDMMGGIGDPSMSIGGKVDWLLTKFEEFIGWLADNEGVVKGIIVAFGGLKVLGAIFGGLGKSVAGSALQGFLQNGGLAKLFGGAGGGAGFAGIITKIGSALATAAPYIGIAVAAFVALLEVVPHAIAGFKELFAVLKGQGSLKDLFGSWIDGMTGLFTGFWNIFLKDDIHFSDLITGAMDKIKEAFADGGPVQLGLASAIANVILFFQGLPQKFSDAFSDFPEKFNAWFVQAGQDIEAWFLNTFSAENLQRWGETIKTLGHEIPAKIWEGITEKAGALIQSITDWIKGLIAQVKANLTGSIVGGASGQQTGGPVVAGTAQTGRAVDFGNVVKVGETGTELFSPPMNGHITSHSLLSNMMSQSGNARAGNTYNVRVQGSPVAMKEEDLMRLMNRMEFLHG